MEEGTHLPDGFIECILVLTSDERCGEALTLQLWVASLVLWAANWGMSSKRQSKRLKPLLRDSRAIEGTTMSQQLQVQLHHGCNLLQKQTLELQVRKMTQNQFAS